MKSNQLKIGSILSYVQMAISILIGIIYTPTMIRLLGASEYGLYNTVASTISMLSLLSLGFNSSYVRYFTKYKTQKDNQAIYKLNGLFILIFTLIGIIALCCGIYITFHLDIVFKDGLTIAEYEIAEVLMLLLTVNLAISFPMSVFSSIISANEKYVVLKLLGMVKTVFGPLATLPLLLAGFGSIAMVVVTVTISLIVDIVYVVYVVVVLKNKFYFSEFEKGIIPDLFVYTIFIAMNMVVDQINWNIDKILLGRFKGTSAVAVYSVGYSLYNYYMMFSTSISGVFVPRVHKLVCETESDSETQRKCLTELVIKVGRIQFIVLSLISSGMLFFGRYFIINIWAGKAYSESYIVALMLIFAASIPLIQNVCIEIQRAQNKHKFRSIAYLIMAMINLIASCLLAQKYGTIGCAFATMVSILIANGLIMNIYYHKKCNIDMLQFWKNILSCSKGLIIPICIGVIVSSFVLNIISFFASVFVYILIFAISMWKIGMNNYEKQLVLQPLKRIKGKMK